MFLDKESVQCFLERIHFVPTIVTGNGFVILNMRDADSIRWGDGNTLIIVYKGTPHSFVLPEVPEGYYTDRHRYGIPMKFPPKPESTSGSESDSDNDSESE